ncbi:amidohydrolase [Microbacterium sp. VKM Ac-2870]|nr:amidohydrolase [Microbacterium sp. VKM Ac-2870]MBF4561223.1 amidohydrolase [Microbacterium sp. VKM Ac-2870]
MNQMVHLRNESYGSMKVHARSRRNHMEFDLAITGASLLVGADFDVIVDGAVGIRDGRIAWLGRSSELGEHDPRQTIDAAHTAVLPSFVNAHTHLPMSRFRGLADDVTLDEFISRTTGAEQEELTRARVEGAARSAAIESILGGTTAALDMYPFDQEVALGASSVGLAALTGPTYSRFASPDARDFDQWLIESRRQLESLPLERRLLAPHSAYGLSFEEMCLIGELAAELQARIHVHASESDEEVAQVTQLHGARPIEVLERAGLLGPRTVVAHAVSVNAAEIQRLADTGTSVAHCPWSNLKLGCGVAPVPAMLAAGVNVAIGTDGTVSSPALDVWSAVRLVANVHKGWSHDPQAVSAREALRMATVGGQRAIGRPDAGTLAVGAPAHLQAVRITGPHLESSRNLLASLVYAGRPSDVRHVIADGRIRVFDGELVLEGERMEQ